MDRIVLLSDQQTTIAIAFARHGKTVTEAGDTILVASSAGTILNATFNPETGLVDVIPIDGAVGIADVMVTATLADGTALPPQTVGFEVKHPDADALVLQPGEIVEKTVSIPVPLPNAPAVVIADDPVDPVDPAAAAPAAAS